MPFDSTADLLFRIGADSSDAESNIQRFRGIFGKNLGDMQSDFEAWSAKMFGTLSTPAGIATAGGAVLAAGIVAAGGAAVHAADQYAQYVEEIERGSKVAGMGVEAMSGLRYAAEQTGTKFDELTPGRARYTSEAVEAAEGSKQQLAAFERLGISQEQVKAGEKDSLPLLELVGDRIAGLSNKTDQLAAARDLFGRSGAQFLTFLKLGKTGIEDMAAEAAKLGLVITSKDVVALHEWQAATATQTAMQKALDVQLGSVTLPIMTHIKERAEALIETMASTAKTKGFVAWLASIARFGTTGTGDFAAEFEKNAKAIEARIKSMAEALEKAGDQPLGDKGDKGVKEAKIGRAHV